MKYIKYIQYSKNLNKKGTFSMGIVEIHWKYIDKSIYKIWGRLEVIWTGFVSKFVIKSSSKKSSATHVSNMYHACISHTGIHGYTCDTQLIQIWYICDTQMIHSVIHISFFFMFSFYFEFSIQTTSKLHQIIPKLRFKLLKMYPIYSNNTHSKESKNVMTQSVIFKFNK